VLRWTSLTLPCCLRPNASLRTRRVPLLWSPDAAACVSGLYQRGPRSLLVHGTTRDGLDVTRRIALSQEQQDGLWLYLRASCRFLPPDDALRSLLRSARLDGRALTLTYELTNDGAVPLVVDRVSYLPGVEVVVDALPVTVPPRAGADAPSRTMVVHLRVTSCERMEATLRAALGGDGLDGPATLKVALHDRHARAQGNLDFTVFRDGDPGTSVDQGLQLLRTCKHVTALLDTQAGGH
jgi:hypothetical protein